jgi:hypothetical protein
MKLVRFDNDTYGVLTEERYFFKVRRRMFVDLKNPQFSWTLRHRNFPECRGTKEEAQAVLDGFNFKKV